MSASETGSARKDCLCALKWTAPVVLLLLLVLAAAAMWDTDPVDLAAPEKQELITPLDAREPSALIMPPYVLPTGSPIRPGKKVGK
jgi:hypothetical protein